MFKTMMKNYSKVIFRILFSFIGVIIGSIVIAARNGVNPQLLVCDYSKKAGFLILGWIIAVAIAAAFGGLTALFIRIFMSVS